MLPRSGKDAILSDTVGFISNLPTQLIEAFRVRPGRRGRRGGGGGDASTAGSLPAIDVCVASQPFVASQTFFLLNWVAFHLWFLLQATLEEVTEADLLLHVLDVSSPQVRWQQHRQPLLWLGWQGRPAACAVCQQP